jgi:site-specific DNA recombinase
MTTALLYIRVSTDEQADKGYSQRNQEEVLKKYCEQRFIEINDTLFEDHSAKSFNRPVWKSMLHHLRRKKSYRPDLILFTKWDRFSRNTSDAYQMISYLKSFDIEPKAIEQPLDLSIPENKMMLAFYLAIPEVENERRGLNIFYGLRRARKEGRWINTAPIGYVNKTAENGTKYISPDEKQSKILAYAFGELATAKYAIDQVWKKARTMGLRCERNNFLKMIRNPVYCGKVIVPAYKDEEPHEVQGQHQAIISAELFKQVQDVINSKKRIKGTKMVSVDQLPLRGFLVCPKCERMLTGSASKGRTGYYHYYHCSSRCGVRHRAEKINTDFIGLLANLKPQNEFHHLFKKILKDVIDIQNGQQDINYESNLRQLELLEKRKASAKTLILAGDLEGEDYREIQAEIKNKIGLLQTEIAAYQQALEKGAVKLVKLEPLFLDLVNHYKHGESADKRLLIAKVIADDLRYETWGFKETNLNTPVKIIYRESKTKE